MAVSNTLSDADLHGLVDGHLDLDRRAVVLQRAAGSPCDRATVESWQDQADLIRAAFGGVERETLPAALDLRMLPRVEDGPLSPAPAARRPTRRWFRWSGAAVTAAAMAIGLGGSWYIAGLPVEPVARVDAREADADEKAVADRALAALAFGEPAPSPVTMAEAPPLDVIPDLSGAGFAFTGAEAREVAPRALVLKYRDTAGDRVTLGATRTTSGEASLVRRDGGLTWRSDRRAYALFGTIAIDRLRAVAAILPAEILPR